MDLSLSDSRLMTTLPEQWRPILRHLLHPSTSPDRCVSTATAFYRRRATQSVASWDALLKCLGRKEPLVASDGTLIFQPLLWHFPDQFVHSFLPFLLGLHDNVSPDTLHRFLHTAVTTGEPHSPHNRPFNQHTASRMVKTGSDGESHAVNTKSERLSPLFRSLSEQLTLLVERRCSYTADGKGGDDDVDGDDNADKKLCDISTAKTNSAERRLAVNEKEKDSTFSMDITCDYERNFKVCASQSANTTTKRKREDGDMIEHATRNKSTATTVISLTSQSDIKVSACQSANTAMKRKREHVDTIQNDEFNKRRKQDCDSDKRLSDAESRQCVGNVIGEVEIITGETTHVAGDTMNRKSGDSVGNHSGDVDITKIITGDTTGDKMNRKSGDGVGINSGDVDIIVVDSDSEDEEKEKEWSVKHKSTESWRKNEQRKRVELFRPKPSANHLPATKSCDLNSANGVPSTKACDQTSFNGVPAPKSCDQLSSSCTPATKSCDQNSANYMPVTKSCDQTSSSCAPATMSCDQILSNHVPGTDQNSSNECGGVSVNMNGANDDAAISLTGGTLPENEVTTFYASKHRAMILSQSVSAHIHSDTGTSVQTTNIHSDTVTDLQCSSEEKGGNHDREDNCGADLTTHTGADNSTREGTVGDGDDTGLSAEDIQCMSDSDMATFIRQLVTDTGSSGSCSTALIHSIVTHKFWSVDESPSRELASCLSELASCFAPHLASVLAALLQSSCSSVEADLVTCVCRQWDSDTITHFLRQLCTTDLQLSDGLVTVVQCVVSCQPKMDGDLLDSMVRLVSTGGQSLAANAKFGRLVLSVIKSYGRLLTGSHVTVLATTASTHTSVLRKSLQAALNTFTTQH